MFRNLSIILGVCVFLFSGVANAESKKEAVMRMIDAAIAHYEKVGEEQAFKDFAVKDSDFNHGEFYLFVNDLDSGVMVFHGANDKLVGKNLDKLKDTDGKTFVVDMRNVAKEKGAGWVDYKWPHAVTKKITQKHSYVKSNGKLYFGMGYSE